MQLSDPLIWSQFLNLLKLGMIERSDRLVTIYEKGFSRESDFIRFCPADQSFACLSVGSLANIFLFKVVFIIQLLIG